MKDMIWKKIFLINYNKIFIKIYVSRYVLCNITIYKFWKISFFYNLIFNWIENVLINLNLFKIVYFLDINTDKRKLVKNSTIFWKLNYKKLQVI